MDPMRTMVAKLRGKLGEDARNPAYIFTEPRVGTGCRRGKSRVRENLQANKPPLCPIATARWRHSEGIPGRQTSF